MYKFTSDNAPSEMYNRVKEILRALFIYDWQSESHYQHQNFAVRRCQNVKRQTKTLLERTGTPSHTWLIAMMCICFSLNHVYNQIFRNIPMDVATGLTCDVSPLLRFHFWQHVYFNSDDRSFPSKSTEE